MVPLKGGKCRETIWLQRTWKDKYPVERVFWDRLKTRSVKITEYRYVATKRVNKMTKRMFLV